jgi:hypothetical protein
MPRRHAVGVCEHLDPAGMTSSDRPVRLPIAFVVGVAGFTA